MNLKHRVWAIVNGSDSGGRAGRIFELGMVSLIALNVLALVVETVEGIYRWAPGLFHAFEIFSVAIFTAEYFFDSGPAAQPRSTANR